MPIFLVPECNKGTFIGEYFKIDSLSDKSLSDSILCSSRLCNVTPRTASRLKLFTYVLKRPSLLSPALAAGFLTTAPLGKSPGVGFLKSEYKT